MHADESSGDEEGGERVNYHSDLVNLKLIPDMVVGSQYEAVLLKSPDYLMKFWNACFLVIPIVIGQLLVAWGLPTAL